MKKSIFILVFAILVSLSWATTVYDIQYTTTAGPDNTYPSPMEGQVVTITGIVTGDNYDQDNKFFVSDPEGGAWHGIYIFDYEVGPLLGDEVEITGEVSEYYGFTELTYCTITILSSGNAVPAPINITTVDLAIPALAEQYEGCLVEVQDIEVTESQDQYGQWYIDDGSGEGQVDDEFFYLDSVVPPIVIEVGQTWDILRGCVDYSFDEYGINPRTPDDMIEVANSPNNEIPNTSVFSGCYPNPFNPETTAYFNLAEAGNTKLNVYNMKGEKVRTLLNEELEAGEHHVSWNGNDDQNKPVASGVYFVMVDSNDNDFVSVKKVILLK